MDNGGRHCKTDQCYAAVPCRISVRYSIVIPASIDQFSIWIPGSEEVEAS